LFGFSNYFGGNDALASQRSKKTTRIICLAFPTISAEMMRWRLKGQKKQRQTETG